MSLIALAQAGCVVAELTIEEFCMHQREGIRKGLSDAETARICLNNHGRTMILPLDPLSTRSCA